MNCIKQVFKHLLTRSMKTELILSSLDNSTVNNNREKYQNKAKRLLKDFYSFMKKDILIAMKNRKPINTEKYSDELRSILKTTYKRILIDNPNTIFQNAKTNTKSIIKKINQYEKISENVFDSLNNRIESISNNRSDLIFNNLIDKLQDIQNQSLEDYNEELNEVNKQIIDIDQSISQMSLITGSILSRVRILESRRNNLSRIKENLTQYRDEKIEENFIDKYKQIIIADRATAQAINEVSFFDNLLNDVEYQEISKSNIFYNDKPMSKIEEYKEWLNQLDERSRGNHAEIHGQQVPATGLFQVPNITTGQIEYTSHPQGEGLSIGNSINCRCTVRYFLKYQES